MTGVTRFVKWTVLVAVGLAPGPAFGPPPARAQAPALAPARKDADDLLMRTWNGIQEAQTKNTTGCGTIVETRTSTLLRVPMVFHGRFCASGMDKFFLEYSDPEPVRLIFNRDYLNVTTGKSGKTTEVMKIGSHVKRTQAFFSKENSIRNLKEAFAITAKETPGTYEMRFVPRSQRFKQKLNYLVVTLNRDNFLLRSLEIDGKSGVNSVFRIQIESLNIRLGEELFKVYKQ
jgi:hypothetical protein